MATAAVKIGETLRLCRLDDIEDGRARGFDLHGRGRDTLFVVWRGEQLFAYLNYCPHTGFEGTSLPWRRDAYLNRDGSRIVCSGHGAQFDVETGICTGGPCPGQALTPIEVRLDKDGFVCLPSVPEERKQ